MLSAVQHVAFAPPPAGNTCQNGLMPALVRPTMPAVQTSLGMKHFLPFPLDTAVRLFPGFNTVSLDKVILMDTSVLIVDMSDFGFSRCFFPHAEAYITISNLYICPKYSHLETSLFKSVISDSTHNDHLLSLRHQKLPQLHFVKFFFI